MYAKTMWNKQRYCGQLQNHVRIQNFRRSNWEITMLGKSAYFFVVPWHVRSCQEMCRTILCVGEQKRLNNSTKYQLLALTTTTSKKKNWNPWENCQKYALKLFWHVYTWHVLDDLKFYGQWISLHDRLQNGPRPVSSTSGGTLCVSGSHPFVPISWMCKKQTAVSHSSTESEIISLDTGLRLDGLPGLPALGLWHLIVSKKTEATTYDRSRRPDKTSFLGNDTNQFGPQNPNQIHRHRKPSCWHFNQRSRGNSSRRNRAIRKVRRNTSW